MMMRMGAITENTTVITTVHDCQVVDHLPQQLFKEYDVPVDIIVTPTQVIFVEERLKKPSGILWHMLSERRLRSMQILQQLRQMDEKYALLNYPSQRVGKLLRAYTRCCFFAEMAKL